MEASLHVVVRNWTVVSVQVKRKFGTIIFFFKLEKLILGKQSSIEERDTLKSTITCWPLNTINKSKLRNNLKKREMETGKRLPVTVFCRV